MKRQLDGRSGSTSHAISVFFFFLRVSSCAPDATITGFRGWFPLSSFVGSGGRVGTSFRTSAHDAAVSRILPPARWTMTY